MDLNYTYSSVKLTHNTDESLECTYSNEVILLVLDVFVLCIYAIKLVTKLIWQEFLCLSNSKKKIMNQNTFGTKIPFCDDDEFNLEDDDEEFLICSSAESLSKAKSRFSVSI